MLTESSRLVKNIDLTLSERGDACGVESAATVVDWCQAAWLIVAAKASAGGECGAEWKGGEDVVVEKAKQRPLLTGQRGAPLLATKYNVRGAKPNTLPTGFPSFSFLLFYQRPRFKK